MINKNHKKDTKIPENQDEKLSVQKNDEASKKGFPGYPHYPSSEDIFNKEDEVNVDIEKIAEEDDEIKTPQK